MEATDALKRLQAGNERFVSESQIKSGSISQMQRQELVAGQRPFAVILGCSDSRVPAEIVFDEGLGDLFVIRVAGNIVTPSHIGSVEFAAQKFGTRLVVVLGHSRCGAVTATVEAVTQAAEAGSSNLQAIVDAIRPSVEQLLATNGQEDRDALIEQAIRANVQASVDQLQQGSTLLENMILEDGLLIIGAEYSLETGRVDFFTKHATRG